MDRKHKPSMRALRVQGTSERPRLAVFRSLKHIYAQVIDDAQGKTLAQVSSTRGNQKGNRQGAEFVGSKIAEICIQKQITQIVFDRRQRKYHGCIQILAESARKGGLQF